MLTGSKSSSKSKRMSFGAMLLTLLCGGIVLGLANRLTHHLTGSAGVPARHERAARRPQRTDASDADRMSAFPEALPDAPQSSAQFDLSRHVIAGGGGTSANGNLKLDGTVGQPAAGT